MLLGKRSRPCCIKLTIDDNFAISGNYHVNRAQQPIKIKVLTIDGKVTINGNFCATGLCHVSRKLNYVFVLHFTCPVHIQNVNLFILVQCV